MADDDDRPRGRNQPGGFLRLERGAYHKLPIAAKQALGREHEPPLVAPCCGAKLLPVDMLGHLARCTGPIGKPPERSRWLSLRAARAMGVSRPTLRRWIAMGILRTRERDEVLERDLISTLAWARWLRGRR